MTCVVIGVYIYIYIYLKPQLCTYICSRCCRARFDKERSNQKKSACPIFWGLDSDWEITKRALFNCALKCAGVRQSALVVRHVLWRPNPQNSSNISLQINLLVFLWVPGFCSFCQRTLGMLKRYTKEGLSRKVCSKEAVGIYIYIPAHSTMLSILQFLESMSSCALCVAKASYSRKSSPML